MSPSAAPWRRDASSFGFALFSMSLFVAMARISSPPKRGSQVSACEVLDGPRSLGLEELDELVGRLLHDVESVNRDDGDDASARSVVARDPEVDRAVRAQVEEAHLRDVFAGPDAVDRRERARRLQVPH